MDTRKKNMWYAIIGLLLVVGAVLIIITLINKKGDVAGERMVEELAQVESVSIEVMETFPITVEVTASGNHPDGCTEVSRITSERIDTVFTVTLRTARDTRARCTQALVPFEEIVALDVVNLMAGEYLVDVNGVTGTFTLPIDNVVEFTGEK